MASLSNTMASPEEGSGILFLGFLEEVQAHPWHPVRFPIQHRHPHPKCFPQQCQGHSFDQTRIIILLILNQNFLTLLHFANASVFVQVVS